MVKLFRRLRLLMRFENDLDEELESHRALRQQALERSGMSPQDAARESRRVLGNVTLAREDARAVWVWPWLESVGQDLRIGLRGLAKRPGFAIVAALTMALGVGANTAVFSLLDASLLRVLPVKDPHELVFLGDIHPTERPNNAFPFSTYERLLANNRSLASIAAFDSTRFSVTVEGEPELRRGEFVTGNYFDMLGVRAALGRLITPADDRPGDPVAVLSYGYWAGRFNRNTSAIGKTISVGKTPVTIIGVTPQAFQGRELTSGWSDIVLPMSLQRQLGLRDHTTFGIWARLKPGVTLERAAQDLTAIRRQELAESAGNAGSSGTGQQIQLRSIQLKPALRGERPGLGPERPNDTRQVRLITSAVALVLLIACVNIACLLLSRSAARQREIAVRLAIGASRARLIRQLLTESVVLGALGGIAGLFYLGWATDALMTVLPVGELPFDPRRDLRTLVFTGGVSLATALLFGLVPALTATRIDINPIIQRNDDGAGRASGRQRIAKSLVVAQVALSLALLVGAGLLVRSLGQLYRVDTGHAADRVLTMWMYPTLLGYDHPREMRLYRHVLDTLNATPGIQSASMSRFAVNRGGSNFVAPRYFETIGITVIQGRDFSTSDTASSAKVAIVSETVARKYFAGRNPIGEPVPDDLERFTRGPAQIVGVVSEIKSRYRQATATPSLYAPLTQAPPASLGQVTLHARTIGDPASAVSTVRHAVGSVEGDLALADIQTLGDQLRQSVGEERATAILLGSFGALALLLASIGLFGTMSHSVARRTKELGIRMSLGADRRTVLRMVLRETLTVVAIGVALGLPLALAGTRLVATLLFGIERTDPLTIMTAVAVLSAITTLAGYLPARRAALVDPMVALRHE